MNNKSRFYTLKGYEILASGELTSAMEDYLEMILRISEKYGEARIKQLSANLNVKPSSASKMAANLKELGLVEFKKYGYIRPTEEGISIGSYLIYRHEVLHALLCNINGTSDELEETEKIEHFLSPRTVANIARFLESRFS